MRIPTLRPIKFFSIHSIDSELSNLLLYHIEKFFWNIWSLLDKVFICLIITIHVGTNSAILPILARLKVSNFNFGVANFFSILFIFFYYIFISCVN
jgi:hypothetical protein